MKTNEIYQAVTDRIIALLEQGVAPWRKSWSSVGFHAPRNGVTKREYSGVNLYLSFYGYTSPDFFSFKQIKEAGARIKKGEQGKMVLFWRQITITDPASGEEKEIPMLRYYTAWNREQCEGLPVPADEDRPAMNENEKISSCEALLNEYRDIPTITAGTQAFYRPSTDEIQIPPLATFDCSEEYYSALFHEGIHSTGSAGRLNRKQGGRFGDAAYALEELVAE